MHNLPSIWGGGQLFAFSGLDGQTSWAHPFVGSLSTEGLAVDFHSSPSVVLEVVAPAGAALTVTPRYVLGDVVDLTVTWPGGEGTALAAFADRFTLVGRLTGGLAVGLRDCGDLVETKGGHLALARKAGETLVWALALDPDSGESARERAAAALRSDVEALAAERRAFVQGAEVGNLLPPATERTYRKAASVLKTNAMSAEGSIRRRWTTPDRWPHRHMWLWDSAFHSLGWLYLDPEMARDTVEAMVETAAADGLIPLCSAPVPPAHRVSQPPLLAWAVWEIHQATLDVDFVTRLYEPLAGYVRWFLRERDRNGNGLLEWWKDEEDSLCHCGESGWDNSPRFDRPGIDDHLDLNCMVHSECEVLARIAVICDRFNEALEWRERAAALARRVNERMWDEASGFYYDLRADGERLPIKTAAGFLPLWAGIATP